MGFLYVFSQLASNVFLCVSLCFLLPWEIHMIVILITIIVIIVIIMIITHISTHNYIRKSGVGIGFWVPTGLLPACQPWRTCARRCQAEPVIIVIIIVIIIIISSSSSSTRRSRSRSIVIISSIIIIIIIYIIIVVCLPRSGVYHYPTFDDNVCSKLFLPQEHNKFRSCCP